MKISKLYPFLIFLVIAISGNPAIGVLGTETVYIGSLLIFIGLWLYKPVKFKTQDALIFGIFTLLILTHALFFGLFIVNASLGFLVKLGIAFLATRLIPDFTFRYVTTMYVLSLISFVFWLPLFFGVDMRSIFSALRVPLINSDHFTIVIANLRSEYDGSIRNMGMFWEPGAFAGYLILALFFLSRDHQNNPKILKQGLVLSAALLSTQSTTGYLAFMALSIMYANNTDWVKSTRAKLLVLPTFLIVMVGAIIISVNQLDFVGQKISGQFESTTRGDAASRINRIGNFLYDLEWILKSPIIGWSATPETRFLIDPEVEELVSAQGNGLTGFAVKFGLIGLAVFIFSFGYVTMQITGSLYTSLIGVLLMCILLFGEQFLNFPIFLSLMFLPKRKSKSRNSLLTCNGQNLELASGRMRNQP